MEIRALKYEDIDQVVERRMEFLLEVIGEETSDEFKVITSEYLKKHIDDNSMMCYVAIEDGKIISTVVLCLYDVIPKPNRPAGRLGYVFSVYTLKEYRGKGIAKQLLSRTIETAKEMGVEEIYLNAEVKAIPLYKRLGFQNVDREMVLRID